VITEIFEETVLSTMKFEREDLTLMQYSENDALFKIAFNEVDCGMLMITEEKDLNRKSIIMSNVIKKTIFDFFILMNDLDLVVMFTDHQGTLFPQYVQAKNKNMVELVCGKPFLKNLIANRGVEFLCD